MTLRTLLDRFDLLMDTPASVSKLRQFTIQLATQGHLTERHPDDTPANVLLERIQQEKQRLYDSGEIRKPKAVPDVDESDKVFAVPKSWSWTRLNEVALGLRYGYTASAKEKEDGVRFLRITDIQNNSVDWAKVPSCEIEEDEIDKYRIRKGDLLVARTGGTIGKTFLMPKVPVEAVCASYLIRIRPSPEVSSSYVKRYLESPLYWRQLSEASSGTGQPNVNSTALRELAVPLPPREEQQRIVETVDGLMDECDALEQQQERERTLQVQVGIAATEALQSAENEEDLRPAWERVREHFDTVTATPEGVDALRQSILQLAVQGRLTERDPEDTPADVLLEQIQQEKQRLYDAGEIRKPKDLPKIGDEGEKFDLPSQWVLTRLGRLIHFKNGYAFRSKNYSDEGVGIVKIGDIQDGEVTEQDMDRLPTDLAKKKIEKYNVEPGALLIGMSGSVGKLGFNTSEKTYLLNQRVGKITPISALTGSVSKRYIYHFLRTRVDENLRIAEGSAIKNLSTTQIKETPIPLPPPEEQRRLVEIVDLLMSFCNDLGELLSDSSERGEQLLEAALKDASVDRSDAAPTGATA